MSGTATPYEEVLTAAKSLLPSLVKARRKDIATRKGGDRLLSNEVSAVARKAAEMALPRDDGALLRLAATPGVIYADTWDDRHGDIRSAIIHVLGGWIVRDMVDEADRTYAAQFGDDGAERLSALADEAASAARQAMVLRSPSAGTRGRYDAFDACVAAWRRGEPDSLTEFAAEAEKLISDLATDERIAFQAAGRRFEELLQFALSRPERFQTEPPAPAP